MGSVEVTRGQTAYVTIAFGGSVADAGIDGSRDAALDAGADGGGAGLSIDRMTQDFGTVITGQSSTPALFTITNTGSAATGTPTVSLGGANSSSFMQIASTCLAPLAAGGSCVVAIQFSPGAAGPLTAVFGVRATPGGAVGAVLTGAGVGQGALRI